MVAIRAERLTCVLLLSLLVLRWKLVMRLLRVGGGRKLGLRGTRRGHGGGGCRLLPPAWVDAAEDAFAWVANSLLGPVSPCRAAPLRGG